MSALFRNLGLQTPRPFLKSLEDPRMNPRIPQALGFRVLGLGFRV